jgi:hypothetical protein
MTKGEFISRHKAVEHDLTHLGFLPWGIVFSIEVGMVGWIIYLIVLLFQYFATDALFPILLQAGFCLLVIGGFWVADRIWRRRLTLRKSSLHCPSCHEWLDTSVADTGHCSHCRQRVLDL